MSFLDEVIAGATNDAISTSNLLRKVQVIAHHLKATDVTRWVKSELAGYPDVASLPTYRAGLLTPVLGTWTGYFGSSATQLLSAKGLPDEAEEVLFHTSMAQPIAELEELAALPGDPAHAWDPSEVAMYSLWNKQGKGVWMEDMNLLNAHRVVTRASIKGVIDTVRSTALELALDLQTVDADAGSLNGPTIADAPIASTVNHFTTNIYAQGANVAFGDNATLRSKVTMNDVDSLVAAARELGLMDDGLSELRTAAEAPGKVRAARFKKVLKRIGSGALTLGTAVSAEVVASQIDQLIQEFLGQA